MKTQQQAEREEQQRIKNLVLNYDLRENEDPDGNDRLMLLQSNPNVHNAQAGHEKPTSYHHNRPDRGKDRGGQRVRKLQLSDVDWYESSIKRGSGFARAASLDFNPDAESGNDAGQSATPTHQHGIAYKRCMPVMGSASRLEVRKEQPRRVRKYQ